MPTRTFVLAIALTSLWSETLRSQGAQVSRVDSAALLTHVRVLSHDSLGGRPAGSAGGAAARAYIIRQLEMIGIEKLGADFVLPFSIAGRDGARLEGANVAGVVRGTAAPGRYIVLTAHYDHLPPRGGEIYNGADDNASGTGALLALAAYFKRNPPRNSIIFAAMDAEEAGLQGARAFVANPPVHLDSIIMNVNMDMVGRNDRDELYATGTLHYPFLKQYIEQVQPRARVKLLIGHDEAAPGRPRSDNWTSASDHGAFHARQIPFIYFGVEDHDDYHRPTDEFERLHPSFYVRAIETVLDAILTFDANLAAIAAHRR